MYQHNSVDWDGLCLSQLGAQVELRCKQITVSAQISGTPSRSSWELQGEEPSCLCKPTLLIWDAVMSQMERRVTAYRKPHVASTPSQKWKHTGVEEGMNSMKRNVLGACIVNALFLLVCSPSSPFCDRSWDSPSQSPQHAVLFQNSWP